MKNKIFMILGCIGIILACTGCFKMDSMENIKINVTTYPLEYITNRLYGEHAIINSIYPDGTDIRNYTVSNKTIKDTSKTDLFIYNGLNVNNNCLSNDCDIAMKLLGKNAKLKIIDGSSGMNVDYIEQLWLDPSHLLMVTQNIRNGLKTYINSTYLKQEIDDIYEELKVELSELDAEFKLIGNNALKKTIVVDNNAMNFLSKYGINVISLEEEYAEVDIIADDGSIVKEKRLIKPIDKTINDVKGLIENEMIDYIFVLEHNKQSDTITNIIEGTDIELLTYKRIDNLTDEERDNKDNYVTIMEQNLELLKKELYQ